MNMLLTRQELLVAALRAYSYPPKHGGVWGTSTFWATFDPTDTHFEETVEVPPKEWSFG